MAQDLTDLLSAPATPSDALPAIPAIMNAEALARLMGVSEVTARSVAVKLPGRGRFDVAASLRAYLDRLREQAGRAGRPSAGSSNDETKAATARLKLAQADLAEVKAATVRGELVAAIDVEREWAGLLSDLRNALLAIPSRFAEQTPHMTAADLATLDLEIRTALEGVGNE